MTIPIPYRSFRPFKSRPYDPRNPHGVVEDGEALHFSVMFRDSAAKHTGSTFLTDAERERAIRDHVSYEHGLHVAKFAFMGDRAPAFDRERAEFLARNRIMGGAAFARDAASHPASAHAGMTRALSTARYNAVAPLVDAEAPGGLPNAGGSMHDAGTSTARPAAIDALRAARYTGA